MTSSSSVTLTHGSAKDTTCEISLTGATLTSWKVEGQENIFVSSKAIRDGSKPIRGGIPVCFPAFGPWAPGPQHGFARGSNKWKIAQGPENDPKTGDAKVKRH